MDNGTHSNMDIPDVVITSDKDYRSNLKIVVSPGVIDRVETPKNISTEFVHHKLYLKSPSNCSQSSAFDEFDDEDDIPIVMLDDTIITMDNDQVVINILSPPPTPSPDILIEFTADSARRGSDLPKFMTPDPTFNTLNVTSIYDPNRRSSTPIGGRRRRRSSSPLRSSTPLPIDIEGLPIGRYYLLSPAPSNSSSSLSPGSHLSSRRFSLVPLTPDFGRSSPCNRALSPSDWSNQPSNHDTSEIVLLPYVNPALSDSEYLERQWVLMEHHRTQSSVSLGSLTDLQIAEILNAPQPPPIEFTQEEDYSDIERWNIIGSCDADTSGNMSISVAACRVPRDSTDYVRILRCCIQQLDKICDNDYSLVYFHHGYDALQKPSWKWLANCYRSFDRKFKKNIKKFYIVHPSIKLRVVFKVLKPLVSTHSRNKIIYCQTLADLAQHMALERLDIPKEVHLHDKALQSRSVDNITNTTALDYNGAHPGSMYRVFGGSLSDTDDIPHVIQHCIEHLSKSEKLREEGLFRRNGNATELRHIKEAYNTGQDVDFNAYCPHTVAAVLKTYLRELSVPLLTFESYPTLSHWTDFATDKRSSICRKVLNNIPPVNYCCLRVIILFLNEVMRESAHNKMTSQNLSIVIGPNLTWSRHTITSLVDVNNINTFSQYLLDNPRLLEREANGGATVVTRR